MRAPTIRKEVLMRHFIVVTMVLVLLSACRHTLKYETITVREIRRDVPCDLVKDERTVFLHEEITETPELAIACGVTGIFYGGACWAYLARPFESEIKQTRHAALAKMRVVYKLPPNYDLEGCYMNERIYDVADSAQ